MSKNNLAETKKKEKNEKKPKRNVPEKILKYDKGTGYLIPIKWKYPYIYRKKNYIAIIIGLNERYEFERVFLDKVEFERDNAKSVGIGYRKDAFKEDLIIEEKYSYKEDNTFVSKTNYYSIYLLEGGVYGEKISKNKIKEIIHNKQDEIYYKFREIMEEFGEEFTLYTMESILRQRKTLRKQRDISFFEQK